MRVDLSRPVSTAVRVLLAAVVVVVLVTSPAGAAGPPLEGSGVGGVSRLSVTPLRDAGGNRAERRVLEGSVVGAVTGTFVEDVIGTVHRNGLVTFRGTLVFNGTVAGCGDDEHTITFGLTGRGDVSGAFPVTESQVRVIRQPANTLAISGRGTVHQAGPFLSYQVQYVCR